MDRPQEEIDWHFERFIGIIQKMQDTGDRSPVAGLDWKQVRVEKGRVYWKIFVDKYDEWSGRTSKIFGFVRRKDGAIFRAATLKAPETRTKSAIRGYVYDDHPEEYCGKYGIIYAEGT
jgi:hypothetical protein|tara:strand:- start:176 stop:529 length:354 start_codon:yes stop_codon:yes gene_type:complete